MISTKNMPIFHRRRRSPPETDSFVPVKSLPPEVKFYKYEMCGNDYIIIDNMDGQFDKYASDSEIIKRMLDRRYGIGADLLVELKACADSAFAVVCYGSHGQYDTFSGNGACCAVHLAKQLNLLTYNEAMFTTRGSKHKGVFDEINDIIHIKFKERTDTTQIDADNYLVDPGSPHHVRFVQDLDSYNVLEEGNKLADNYPGSELGVDFVEIDSNGRVRARAYEKISHQEKESCGACVMAVILALVSRDEWDQDSVKVVTYPPPYRHVYMKGGRAAALYTRVGTNSFQDVHLLAKANLVYEGSYIVKKRESDIEHKKHDHFIP